MKIVMWKCTSGLLFNHNILQLNEDVICTEDEAESDDDDDVDNLYC